MAQYADVGYDYWRAGATDGCGSIQLYVRRSGSYLVHCLIPTLRLQYGPDQSEDYCLDRKTCNWYDCVANGFDDVYVQPSCRIGRMRA